MPTLSETNCYLLLKTPLPFKKPGCSLPYSQEQPFSPNLDNINPVQTISFNSFTSTLILISLLHSGLSRTFFLRVRHQPQTKKSR
jgi:hypothetical protein